MSDETKNDLPVESEDIVDEVIDTAIDLVSDQAVPAPIRRGFLAACKRLGVAIADMPAGWFERRSTEKWADTKSRVRIKDALTDEIIKKLEVDPTFPQRAVELFGNRILREQFNLEKVLDFTKDILKSKEYNNSEHQQADSQIDEPISPNWFNIFEKEASQKSTEDMQQRFAQVLAGEIEKPGSHSIKAVKALGEMDQTIATLFQKLCSVCVVLEVPFQKRVFDIRVPSAGGNPGQNSLSKYGLSYDNLNKLHEYGLIISDYNSYFPYQVSIMNKDNQVAIPFRHQGQHWVLKPSPERPESNEFRINGVKLSNVGQELFHIVNPIRTPQFIQDLKEFFEKQNLQMGEVVIQKQNTEWIVIQR